MYTKILIATDGSELAGRALKHGLELAKSVGAEAVIVTVTEMWSALEMSKQAREDALDAIAAYERVESNHARQILSAAEKQGKSAGVTVSTRHVGDSRPAEGILKAARDTGADLIVMATHGRRGVNRVLLGSQTNEVVTHADVPVLVLR